MLSFKCRDIEMDCPFEATAASDEEMAEHAKKAHNMKPPFSADMTEKIKKAIKE